MEFSKLADELRKKLVEKTNEMVELKGSTDGFKTAKVIDLDSHQFNNSCSFSDIRYIGVDLMYNESGREYSFSNLELDDFAELVDLLTNI